jgi:hypothetical protein
MRYLLAVAIVLFSAAAARASQEDVQARDRRYQARVCDGREDAV